MWTLFVQWGGGLMQSEEVMLVEDRGARFVWVLTSGGRARRYLRQGVEQMSGEEGGY